MRKIINGRRNHINFNRKLDKIIVESQFVTAWIIPDGSIIVENYFVGSGIEMKKYSDQIVLTEVEAIEFKNKYKNI